METIQTNDIVTSNKECAEKYHKQFYDAFQVKLGQFIHPILGFDIVTFDTKFLAKIWGYDKKISCYMNICRMYSPEAANMIQEILKYPVID